MLRTAEIGTGGKYKYHQKREKLRTDIRLFRLVTRIKNRVKPHDLPNWGEHIDELGKDKGVVNYLGQKIDYKMVWRCDSPNELTCGWGGGDRYLRKKRSS